MRHTPATAATSARFLGLAIAATLALAGCAAEAPDARPTPTPTPTPTATATPSAAPIASPAPTVAPVQPVDPSSIRVGDVVEPQDLGAVDVAGLGTYPHQDGTYLVIDPAQPLPTEVRTDLQARFDAIPADDAAAADQASANESAATALVTSVSFYSHRTVALVRHQLVETAGKPDKSVRWFVMASATPDITTVSDDKAKLVKRLEKWIAQQPTASQWDVFVTAGG